MKVDEAIKAAERIGESSPRRDVRDLIMGGGTAGIMLDDRAHDLCLARSGKRILTT